jgi:mono/diheme cytochrome c family protein
VRRAWLLVLVSTPAVVAQNSGGALFARTCGSSYCHGARGTGAGAPRLAARGFDRAFLSETITRGVPGTSMPAFATVLSRSDLEAVIDYVAVLNGLAPSATKPAAAPPPALSPEAAAGRNLFSDSLRGFGRCSTCHEVNGIGIPVAPPIANIPLNAAALRSLRTPSVRTAKLAAEIMPALLVSNTSRATIFYDLTTPPPVLRTVDPGTVTWTDNPPWRHSSVIASYTDAELTSILAYLRSGAEP